MPYLFQVSLGPVQSFIVAARRTRDLKFSSSFLSGLAHEIALTITKLGDKARLIFPAPETLADEEGMPNKILAYLALSEGEVQKLADEDIVTTINTHVTQKTADILSHIEERLKNRAGTSDLLEEMRRRFAPGGNTGQVGRAAQQIQDLVEYIWVAIPYDEQKPAEYAAQRDKLEALLSIRKNTRDFAPAPLISREQMSPMEVRRGIPKSSIDGLLESVIPEEAYPPPLHPRLADDAFEREKASFEHKARLLREAFDVGPREKLSGVDLLKRLGTIQGIATSEQSRDKRTAFPSTSHIAALPFLAGLQRLSSDERESAQQQLNAYINQLEQVKTVIPSFELDLLPKAYQAETREGEVVSLGAYDGALLYPERFPDVVGDAQEFQQARDSFQQATKLLDALLHNIGFQPTPYYALFQADGDSMGKLIDAQARQASGMQRHRQLSESLAELSTKIKDIVKYHQGVLVYTGGDDVLAFLPLHTALKCAITLAREFKETLKEFADKEGKPPTLSAGLAILHHLHPLNDALNIAREAEKRAKSGTKNTLAITLQKRGGPPCEVGGEWEPFSKRLEELSRFCQNATIPSGMAYELKELALRLTLKQEDEHKQTEATPAYSPAYIRYTALRVFQRKLGEAGKQRADKLQSALALYALMRMVGLIATDDDSETPEQAFESIQKRLKLKEEESAALRERAERFNQLQPVDVEALADELIVARFFADARRLAHEEQEAEVKGGEQQ